MNIVPKDGPAISQPTTANASARDARDRAIAKLTEGAPPAQSNELPVSNANHISPEEMSAIVPRKTEISTSETTSEEPEAKAASKEDPMSTHYANLARKERALRAKDQAYQAAVKAREAEFVAREEALKAKEAEYQSNYIPKSRFKQDPLSVLTEEGISYDDITKAILSPQVQQDPRVLAELENLKSEIKAQREQQERNAKAYEDQQQQAYKQAVSEIRNEAKRLVTNDPNFETIKVTNSISDVVDLIEKVYHKDGILMSVEDAAKEVEDYLVEEATKLARISKIQKRLQGSSPAKQEPAPTTQKPQTNQITMKTLTNSVNASKKLSSRERAIAAFKGEKL